MAWDTTKIPNDPILSAEWNAHVTDQKARAWKKIAEQVLTVETASVVFGGIAAAAAGCKNLMLVANILPYNPNYSSWICVRVNGMDGSHSEYSWDALALVMNYIETDFKDWGAENLVQHLLYNAGQNSGLTLEFFDCFNSYIDIKTVFSKCFSYGFLQMENGAVVSGNSPIDMIEIRSPDPARNVFAAESYFALYGGI